MSIERVHNHLLVVRRKGRDGPEQTESNVSNSGFRRRPPGHVRGLLVASKVLARTEQQCVRLSKQHAFAHGVHNVVSNTRVRATAVRGKARGPHTRQEHLTDVDFATALVRLSTRPVGLLVVADAVAHGWMMRNPLISGMPAQQVQTRAPAAY